MIPTLPGSENSAQNRDADFGKLAREMIVARLKGSPDAPRAAAEIVKRTVAAGVKFAAAAGLDAGKTTEGICFEAMCGVLMIEKDLPGSALQILRELGDAAAELDLSSAELMTWGMEGIARFAAVAPPQTHHRILEAIQEEYHGAGDVFGRLCDKYIPAPSLSSMLK